MLAERNLQLFADLLPKLTSRVKREEFYAIQIHV